MRKRVLFVCNRNAGRSQIAEGLLKHDLGDRYEAYSAGFEPASRVDPDTVLVMQKAGIDISNQRPKHILEFRDISFDVIVFLCSCEYLCPPLPGASSLLHREFPDPLLPARSEQERLARLRGVRDEIREWLKDTFGNGISL
ncbi:MAG: arsenate reductase ArsC [Methanomicrobiaceae archaeon]|nr:arsenate reductase ArsC [Methanomicrobiaceae archaeon]